MMGKREIANILANHVKDERKIAPMAFSVRLPLYLVGLSRQQIESILDDEYYRSYVMEVTDEHVTLSLV